MNSLKFLLLFYLIISQTIISKENIVKDNFPQYPYLKDLTNVIDRFSENIYNDPVFIRNKLSTYDYKPLVSALLATSFPPLYSLVDDQFFKKLSKLSIKAIKAVKEWVVCHPYITTITVIGIVTIGVGITYYSYKKNKENTNIVNATTNYIEKNQKYQTIIEDNLKEDIEQIIENGFIQLNLIEYIKDFTKDSLNELNSRFKGDSDSLTFMLIGTTGAGKSTFINNILNLIPGITGPSVNESYGQSTTKDFKKYNIVL